jgi:diguanylate cyclase (GGDEF)-like protein/PAS domain S-box-containing protein
VSLQEWSTAEFRAVGRALNVMATRIASTQAELARSEALHRAMTERSSDLITLTDMEGHARYVSPAAYNLLGWSPEELKARGWEAIRHPADAALLREGVAELCAGAETVTREMRVRHKAGHHLWLEIGMSLTRDPITGAPDSVVCNAHDISGRREEREQLASTADRFRALAATDGLTGLANRRSFDETFDREWRRARREETPLALLMIDADKFKALNDRYGHPQGDRCLKAITAAIAERVRRPGDLAARYGGEEFAVLLPGTEAAGAHSLAEDIRRAVLALGIEHAGSAEGRVTVSIGAACVIPGDATAPAQLLAAADAALYAAKANGRNRVEVAASSAVTLAEPGHADVSGG